MHDGDVNIPCFEFLNDPHVTTKKLSGNAFELIRRIRLNEFLLANTNTKIVASEFVHYHEERIWKKRLEVPHLLNGCVYNSKNQFHAKLSSRQLILQQEMCKIKKDTTRKYKTK